MSQIIEGHAYRSPCQITLEKKYQMTSETINVNTDYDLICVGGGIMSASLALLTKLIQPNLKVLILERLNDVALESSAAWNNAGTGHSALCELNYTPEKEDGSIDISKALKICKQFEISKQFWSYLVDKGFFPEPTHFINRTPHQSFVWGDDNVAFLRKRYETLSKLPMFSAMQYTQRKSQRSVTDTRR